MRNGFLPATSTELSELVYLSAVDIRTLLDLDALIQCVEDAYVASSDRTAALSVPRSLTVQSKRAPDVSTMVKGAAIHDVIGARVITSGAEGGKGSRIVVLADGRTGQAIGILDESETYALRVGAQATLAVKHLAKSGARTAALIGSGELARGVARCLARIQPTIRLRVTSRDPAARNRFRAWCEDETGLAVEAFPSVPECCRGADVVLTATSAKEPLITADLVQEGMLIVPVGGGQELHDQVIEEADLLFADDVEFCRMFGSLRPLLAKDSSKLERRTALLGDVITRNNAGRRTDQDIIVAVPQGLASADLAIAASLLNRARNSNLGTKLLRKD